MAAINGDEQLTLDPVLRPFFDFWMGYVRQADDKTRELFEGFDNGAKFKGWQRQWMDAVSQSMDAFMRTPTFLEAMKRNTDTVVKVKQQVDDWTKEAARNANIPTTGDISGLFERLHSVEDIILEKLTRIEERLQALEVQTHASQLSH